MKQKNTQHRNEGAIVREDIDMLSNTALTFTLLALWPGKTFIPKQLICVMKHVYSFIMYKSYPYLAYIEYCQRILLTWHYIALHPEWQPGTPAFWLHDKTGFSLSAGWYKSMEEKRVTEPLYLHKYKVLAEAILEMNEGPSPEALDYWVHWFMTHKATKELTLFLSMLAIPESKMQVYE